MTLLVALIFLLGQNAVTREKTDGGLGRVLAGYWELEKLKINQMLYSQSEET